ncbi:MAG: PilZ domain-containing protein [Nitrospiraceae bacterium]
MISENDALSLESEVENRRPVVDSDIATVMNDPVAVEHRKHPRHPVCFKSIFSTDGVRIEDGVVLDLSLGGCRMTSTIPIPSGTPMELHIRPDQHSPVYVPRGIVRWVGDSTFGVEFNEVPELESATLTRLLWSLPC